jgi:cathepsin L
MRALIAVLLLSALVGAFSTTLAQEENKLLFTAWAKKHNKSYASVDELSRRFAAWTANLDHVNKHNAEAAQGKHSYTLGMNNLADLTNAEYRQTYLGYRRSNMTRSNKHVFRPSPQIVLPASVDWRTKGVVTEVKDQGQCGSCWSFSAVGSMEGAHALDSGDLVSLSEQQLVDCVSDGDFTCDVGGEMTVAFDYLTGSDPHGSEGEEDYPYCACSGNSCDYDESMVRATFSSYQTVPSGDEDALQQAVYQQPGVSVAIDASSWDFQLYSSGVYDEPDCSSTDLDHGVLAVGYGTDSGDAFWLVKNSWSDSWGMNGYIEMSRNKDNQCGIATDASYVLV